MKYSVGEKVRVELSGAGVTTQETFPVLEVSEGNLFLDDGSGWDDPLGPFDAATGVFLGDMMPGWRRRIVSQEDWKNEVYI